MALHKPEACRRYARVYDQHAERTRDPGRQAAMRDLAQEWRQMAEQVERQQPRDVSASISAG
jgi:hypothetical protein